MDALLPTLTFAHSLLRWLLLLFLLQALLRAVPGWLNDRVWRDSDDAVGRRLTITADLQLLLGLALYAFSPTVRTAMADMAGAMKNAALRFWAVEHASLMLLAVIFIHIGRARSRRKGPSDRVRHRRAAIGFGLALLAILLAMPWPWLAENARPYLPSLPF